MKRLLCGWVPAALCVLAFAPGCAENNEAAVTSGSGTAVAKAPEGGVPTSQADIAKRGQAAAKGQYNASGYPGAAKK